MLLAVTGAAAGGGVVVAGGPAGGLVAGVCAGNVPARLSPINTANVHNSALIGRPDSGCNSRVTRRDDQSTIAKYATPNHSTLATGALVFALPLAKEAPLWEEVRDGSINPLRASTRIARRHGS